MPVVTRSQAKQLAASGQPEPLLKLDKNPRVASRDSLSSDSEDDSQCQVPTPEVVGVALPVADQPVKPSTASKAPFSHPLVEETSALSLEDSPNQSNGFKIPAVQATDATNALEASFAAAAVPATSACSSLPEPTSTNAMDISAQEVRPNLAPQPPRRLAPEEKLLKPLPDRPIECTKLPDGPEPVVIEIEYPATEDLQPLEGETSAALDEAVKLLDSADWAAACAAHTTLRRGAVHHKDVCVIKLAEAVPKVVKAARSLRSALSKTAILTLRDLYVSCPTDMLPLSDVGGVSQPLGSVLAQLLLKAASNDKKFVIEEAQRTLVTMSETLPAVEFLSLLGPYSEHKNPKVRGKTATVMAACVAQLQPLQAYTYGMDALLNISARLITDNTPEARESAKRIVAAMKDAFENEQVASAMNIQVPAPAPLAEGEEPAKELTRWEYYCQTVLGPSKAASFLRAAS